MRIHWHGSIEDVLMYGISAIIVIDVLGIAAAQMAKRDGIVGTLGHSLGAIVPFKG